MTTTAESYAPPRAAPASTGDATDVVAALLRARHVASDALASLASVTTLDRGTSMAPERRAELLRELAELSIDPDSMDRESEVDIWGFRDGE